MEAAVKIAAQEAIVIGLEAVAASDVRNARRGVDTSSGDLAAKSNPECAPERPRSEVREEARADDPEGDAESVDLEQRARAEHAERRVERIDHGRAGADGDADRRASRRSTERAQSSQIGPTCAATRKPRPRPAAKADDIPSMRAEGVEPPRAFAQWLLRPSRLPVPPRPRTSRLALPFADLVGLAGVPPTTIRVVGDSVASNLRLTGPSTATALPAGTSTCSPSSVATAAPRWMMYSSCSPVSPCCVLGDQDVAGVLRHGVDAERGDAEVVAHRLPRRRPVRLHRWDVVDRGLPALALLCHGCLLLDRESISRSIERKELSWPNSVRGSAFRTSHCPITRAPSSR